MIDAYIDDRNMIRERIISHERVSGTIIGMSAVSRKDY